MKVASGSSECDWPVSHLNDGNFPQECQGRPFPARRFSLLPHRAWHRAWRSHAVVVENAVVDNGEWETDPEDGTMATDYSKHGFSTRAIHAGQDPDPATGATVVPIYATSTYTQEGPGKHKGYEYSRSGNPTRTALELCLASLEGGERGLAFASGLAATTAVLSVLRPGDEVVAAADLYGGTYRLLEGVFKPWGLVTRYTEDPSPQGFARAISPS